MANSVVKLTIDSAEYDAKLKSAGDALNKYFDIAKKGDRTFEQLDDGVMDAVKAMGRMETTSKSARGQLSELTKTFTDLSLIYKRFTDQEKASPVGKEMAKSLQELKTRISDTKKDLADISKELNGDSTAKGGGLNTLLSVFGGNVLTKATGTLTSEITNIVKRSTELATKADGIQIAFRKLGSGDILDGLRRATHNTVSDLELMKAAVKFNDFKLPLDQLGTMLAFAQKKAKDTGQSVDYMVDSIVTGLGRKSLQILDNLGISASEVRDKMKETGDMTKAVGEIIREQMEKAGDYVETASDRAAKANVELENQMLKLGETMRDVFGFDGWDQMANSIRATLASVLADVIEQLGTIKGILGGLTVGQAKTSRYGTSGVPAEVERDLQALKNASGADRDALYSRMLAKYEKRYNAASASLAKAQGGYDFNENSSNWQGVPFVRKALDRHYWSTRVNTARSNAQAEAEVLAAFRSGAAGISNPSVATPAIVSPTSGKGGGKSPAAEATYEFLEDVRNEKPKVYDFMDATSNVTKSMKDLQQQMKLYKDILANATTQSEYNMASAGISALQRQMKLQPIALEGGITIAEAEAKEMAKKLKEDLEEQFKKNPLEFSNGDKSKNSGSDTGMSIMNKMYGGISNIAGGIEQLGIKLPDGLHAVLSGIQGIATILSGISAIVSAIEVMTTVSSLPFFARGGIAHAANGLFVPGNSYSGDNVPALLNSGELILNKAAQGNLASQLQEGNGGKVSSTPYVSGEQIYLGLTNYLIRSGRGELLTARG